MDVLPTSVSPRQREEMEKQFKAGLLRLMLHIKYAEIEAGMFSQEPFLRLDESVSPFKRFSRELFAKLKETSHKIQWFIGVAKKIQGPAYTTVLDRELDPDGHKINNVAQLTEWVATSSRDLTNEIDLVVNPSRRRDLMKVIWEAAMSATITHTEAGYGTNIDQVMQDFNAWYNAHYATT